MKKATLIIIAVFLALALPAHRAGATISVSLQLDRDAATVADFVTLTVRVSGCREIDARPVIKGTDAFEITPAGTASRVEVVNGKVSSGIDYTYRLRPVKTGTFEIGPARVTVEGKTVSSNTVTLVVSRAPVSSGANRGPVFLKATLSASRVYAEEQTIYSLKLYHRVRISDISLDLPDMEHVTFRQLGKPLQYQATYNGVAYRVLEVRCAVSASRAGTYAIRPARMGMTVYRRRSRGSGGLFNDPFFDDPFFSMSSAEPLRVDSEPLELEVLPLPEKGRPPGFSGLVGTFRVSATLAPGRIKSGDSATLTVVVKGRGNVKRIPDLEVPVPDGIKVYPDRPVLKEETGPRGVSGSKTLKWALVPERAGRYDIPSLSISYFDTGHHAYRTLKTPPLLLRVLPGAPASPHVGLPSGSGKKAAPGAPAGKAVREIGHDILPIHTSIREAAGSPGPAGMTFWLLLAGPFVFYFAVLCGVRVRRRAGDDAAARARKAAARIIRQCRRGDLSAGVLLSLVTGYFNDRFGLSLGTLTPGEASEILRARGVGPERAEEMEHLVQLLENAVYTGRADVPCDTGMDVPALIRRIEKEIR